MSRRNRRGFERPTGEAGGAAEEEETTDGEEETTDEQRETSIADLTTQADPETFDRTYLLDRDDVPLAVDETPAIPRPWEGLPRMAVVYNFNYVYDETAEEWVRQNPFSGGGGGVSTTRISKTMGNGQTFSEFDNDIITMQSVDVDQLGTADLANNGIDIPADGTYRVTVSAQLNNIGTDVDFFLSVDRSLAESFTVDLYQLPGLPSAVDKFTGSNSLVADFADTDTIRARLFSGASSNFQVIGRAGHRTFLEVEQLE